MTVACAISLSAMAGHSDAFAQHYPAKSEAAAAVATADLEAAFWVCDYIATTRGLEATPVEFCMSVTDGLKNDKFGGDFHVLLSWWRQHKRVEHDKLHAVTGERGVDSDSLLRRGSDAL
jgi:hypothetical protein